MSFVPGSYRPVSARLFGSAPHAPTDTYTTARPTTTTTDPDGTLVVRALAVASEPYIFWRGEGAADMIAFVLIVAMAGPHQLWVVDLLTDQATVTSSPGHGTTVWFTKRLEFTDTPTRLVPRPLRN